MTTTRKFPSLLLTVDGDDVALDDAHRGARVVGAQTLTIKVEPVGKKHVSDEIRGG